MDSSGKDSKPVKPSDLKHSSSQSSRHRHSSSKSTSSGKSDGKSDSSEKHKTSSKRKHERSASSDHHKDEKKPELIDNRESECGDVKLNGVKNVKLDRQHSSRKDNSDRTSTDSNILKSETSKTSERGSNHLNFTNGSKSNHISGDDPERVINRRISQLNADLFGESDSDSDIEIIEPPAPEVVELSDDSDNNHEENHFDGSVTIISSKQKHSLSSENRVSEKLNSSISDKHPSSKSSSSKPSQSSLKSSSKSSHSSTKSSTKPSHSSSKSSSKSSHSSSNSSSKSSQSSSKLASKSHSSSKLSSKSSHSSSKSSSAGKVSNEEKDKYDSPFVVKDYPSHHVESDPEPEGFGELVDDVDLMSDDADTFEECLRIFQENERKMQREASVQKKQINRLEVSMPFLFFPSQITCNQIEVAVWEE